MDATLSAGMPIKDAYLLAGQEAVRKYNDFMHAYTVCVLGLAIVGGLAVQLPRLLRAYSSIAGVATSSLPPAFTYASNHVKGLFQAVAYAAITDGAWSQYSDEKTKRSLYQEPLPSLGEFRTNIKSFIDSRSPTKIAAVGMLGGVVWELLSMPNNVGGVYDWDDTYTMAEGFSLYVAMTKVAERFAYNRYIKPTLIADDARQAGDTRLNALPVAPHATQAKSDTPRPARFGP